MSQSKRKLLRDVIQATPPVPSAPHGKKVLRIQTDETRKMRPETDETREQRQMRSSSIIS